LEDEVADLKQRLQTLEAEVSQLRERDAALQEVINIFPSSGKFSSGLDAKRAQEEAEASGARGVVSERSSSAPVRAECWHTSSATESQTPSTFSSRQDSSASIYPFQADLESIKIAQEAEGLSFSFPLNGWFESTFIMGDNPYGLIKLSSTKMH
jgi:hypothetical protein